MLLHSYVSAAYASSTLCVYAQIDDLSFVLSQDEIDQVGLRAAPEHADNTGTMQATSALQSCFSCPLASTCVCTWSKLNLCYPHAVFL